jgi:hypothetical protein
MSGTVWRDGLLLITFAAILLVLISPPVRRSSIWAPMVTPLASIIGSGFLVSVPLLASRLGVWALAAITGLCVFAYLVGGAIRYNIANAEPLLKSGAPKLEQTIERISHLVLTGAYFVSVSYYLALLGAFALKLASIDVPRLGTGIASAIVVALSATGILRGLRGIEGAEKFTVGANLGAILALLAVLALSDTATPAATWSNLPGIDNNDPWALLRFLMGLLIVVQGFETTRFMGKLYDAPTRIKGMRRAQIVASMIYITFFALMLPLFGNFHHATDVAGFIEVIVVVSPWLPWLMTLGAIASQLSAAVADSIGASGLIADLSAQRISERRAFWMIGPASLAVLWLTNVIGLVALASRAFALFYALQCLVATQVARRRGETGRTAWYGLLGLLCFAIAILGVPAGG